MESWGLYLEIIPALLPWINTEGKDRRLIGRSGDQIRSRPIVRKNLPKQNGGIA